MSTDHEQQIERMQRDERKLQEGVDRLGEKVDEARKDWRAKQDDDKVPGAEPRREDDDDQEQDAE